MLGTNTTHTDHIQNFTAAPSQSGVVSTNFVIGMTAAYTVIFLVALFGNSFGLFVVLKKSSSRIATNLFIANMAVADLLLTFTVMPFSIAFFYRDTRWFGGVLGTVTCKVLNYVIPISIAATVFTMMFISFDRFYAIFYPLREKLFRWILPIVLMIPFVFLFQVEYKAVEGAYFCTQVWPWADPNDPTYEETYRVLETFHIVCFITLYVLPLCVTGTNCSLICRKLWLRQIPGNVSDRNRANAEKSKRKVVRLLVTVCVVFALCWFPIYVNHYFWYVRPDQIYLLPMEVQLIFFWLSHAKSAINPCLYVLLNSEFRTKFFAILVCHSEVAPRPLPQQPVPLVVRGRPLQLEQHNRQHVEGPVIE